jgi:MmyB-like transcription regulator ligand binding domain
VHPMVGCLVLDRTTLQVPATPDLKIIVYTPAPETDTARKLQRLLAAPADAVSVSSNTSGAV